ncbi:hypothetical protein PNEG_02082 [Pneumocystis murina B123]|uniref:26S proteasome complex subunit SEM1 n=1 Tax=Pneumocystis murina (strain B123) TaxID=1069680 RepID=M7NLF2_PNEMU|nr:hypothetical protein PNEG_02082 [Pneumocystis murina B123]EMR09493.1 hypothetical protein PNEG_02082 [Pneumocystis murina B123]
MSIKGELDESKKKTEEKDQYNSVLTENTAEEKKIDINTLDDDDEFEDFQAEDWTEADTDLGISKDKLWDDNWDDDDIEDSFSISLRAELQKFQTPSV